MVRTNRALVVLLLVLGTSCGAPAVVLADLFTFNAGLNTTPQEQGWALEVQGTPSPYEVGGGTLMQMATFDNSVTTWNVKANAFDFSSSTPTVVDALMLVEKSDYVVLDGAWRSGYAFTMTDVHDRHFVLGIATTGVRLTNDLSWLESSS